MRNSPSRPRSPLLLWASAILLALGALLFARALRTSALPSPPSASAPSSVAPVSAAPPGAPTAEDHTPEIRGRILDAEGNGVDGAAVRLVSPRPPFTVFRDVKSDRAGRFSFPRLRVGRVRVVADRDPDGVVTSAELHASEGESLEVTLVLSAARAVRGTVVDAARHPVAGAAISVEGVPWIVRTVTSDAAGAFRIPTVPQEATSLVTVARGYRTARTSLPRRDDPAEVVVRVELGAASPVRGDVRDVDGDPVRARVVACDGEPSEAQVESGEDGAFELPPSAIGCDAVAEHDEFAPSDRAAVIEGRRPALRLKQGGSIEGVVVDERGAAVPSFTVGIESFSAARRRGGPRVGGLKFDDAGGAFRWEKLPPGSYVLGASAPGRSVAHSDPIAVTGGAATRGVRITIPRGGAVAGRVVDDRGGPVADAELRFDVVSAVLESNAAAKTDAAGQYRIDGAPSGPFTLRVTRPGFRVRLLSGLRVASGAALTVNVALTALDGGATIELGGIGANVQETREGIVLAHLFDGDPGLRAGLRAGDRVLRIDDEETDGMSVADVMQRLRGEAGTSVGVTVRRPETGEMIDVVIERGRIVH